MTFPRVFLNCAWLEAAALSAGYFFNHGQHDIGSSSMTFVTAKIRDPIIPAVRIPMNTRWQKIVFCRSDRLHFSEAAIWKGAAMNTSADIGSPQIGWNSSIFMISYTIFPWFLTRTCRNSLRHSHSGEPRLHLSALARLALRETLRSGSSKLPKATRGGHWSLFWDLRPNPVVLKIVFPIKIAKMGYPPFEIF